MIGAFVEICAKRGVRRAFLLAILFASFSVSLLTAAPYRMVESLDIESGLSENGVTEIFKDSRGYIWIGTYDGLVRYSNSQLTTYSNTLEEKIFKSNRIRAINEDANGDLWIGTDRGVTLYKYDLREFENLEYNKNVDPLKGCIVREIINSQDGRFVYCLTERSGVLVYSSDAELLRQVTLDSRLNFQCALHICDETYLFGSNQGLILYDFTNGNMERVYKRDSYNVSTPACLMRESDTTLLYGSFGGVRRINIRKGRDAVLDFEFEPQTYYPDRVVKSLCRDQSGRIYLGMVSTGVCYVDELGDELMSLIDQRRTSMLLPLAGGELWVATFDDGAMLFDRDESAFCTFDTSYFERSIFRTTQIHPYDDLHVLCRHNFYQISLFNIETGEVSPNPIKIKEEELNNLKYIHRRENGDFWFLFQDSQSTWWRIKSEGQTIGRPVDATLLSNFKFTNTVGMVEDMHGYIWIASGDLLLRFKMDDSYRTVSVESVGEHPIFSDDLKGSPRVRSLYVDPIFPERLYIATTSSGLYVVDTTSPDKSVVELPIKNYNERSESVNPISSNFVSTVFRTPNGTLWVGTEPGGICRVDESGDRFEFKAYGTSQGLANNSVKSMLCDAYGKMWVSTNNGLSCYDEQRDRFDSYYREQGVPFNTFDYPAFSHGDRIFFASGTNTCYFNPSKLPLDHEIPRIIFDELKLYDQTIYPTKEYDGRVILQSGLKSGDLVTLKHDERHFTIGLDVMCSNSRHNHTVQYRLLPISNQWSMLPQMSSDLSFRGLRPGEYQLEVRTANALGEFGAVESLHIRVKCAAWLTLWAIMLYVVVAISIVVIAILNLMRMQRLRYQLHIEALSKHNLETLNAEKMHYFSNMSHEIKTPLTLIMAPLSALSNRFSLDADVSRGLALIRRQSQKIYELVELMHGVQLNDSNLLVRADSEFVMEDLLREICADFEHVTLLDHKNLTVECSSPRFMVCADRSMIEKIVDNLLSNAIKHTKAEDKITLRCSADGAVVRLEVEDTGFGIDPNDLPNIFERFFRAVDRQGSKSQGTGIGLYFSQILAELHGGLIKARSELGRGSLFSVELPIIIDCEVVPELESTPSAYGEQLVIGSVESSDQQLCESLVGQLVYVVEDNAEMRTMIIELLSNNLIVRGFGNGEEALAALDEEWPDLIISDVMMPLMDGYELCGRVKNDIKTSHIPVILLTACTTVDDKIKGLNSGADSYIAKPFYPKHLLTRVTTLLNNRQRLRERFQVGIPLNYGKNSNTSAKDNEFMTKLYELFNKHLASEDISLNDIAMELGQNRSMFFKKVKIITNTSPFELLKEYRLKRAADMLRDGDHNVNEVCMMTGFKDRSHFSRLFKERYNMSPSKWREETLVQSVEDDKC